MSEQIVYKQEHLDRLRQLHDAIKDHPYRLSLETKYCKSYKDMLYELTVAWVDIVYYTPNISQENKDKLYHFGEWIHNYRARLQMYYPYTFPEDLLDYYEQMLQITHEFLDTGNINTYYALVKGTDKHGNEMWISDRYEWTTKDDVGIDSAILPRYMPKKYKLIVDEQQIHDVINSGYNAVYETVEQRNAWYEFWIKETKPVLEYLNKHNSDRYIRGIGASVIYKPNKT